MTGNCAVFTAVEKRLITDSEFTPVEVLPASLDNNYPS